MSYLGNPITSVAFLTDQFSGNGSTTVFTMSVAPATTSSILVAISGVVQDPSTYSVVGTTLTFSAAPPSGTGNVSVRYLGIPAAGVTTTAYRTVTDSTATAGQTTFSIPSYTVGYLDVYRNGVRLGAADFTATSGTTVVLAVAAAAGDLVTTESFYVSSVLNAIPATAGAVTPAYLLQPLTLTTAQNSTSGTSIDFTGIPSWVKRITVMFNGVSTNGTSRVQVQLGVSGAPEASGYNAIAGFVSTTNNTTRAGTLTTGFPLSYGANDPLATTQGNIVCSLLGSNIWTCTGVIYDVANAGVQMVSGNKTLAGTLNMVRITTVTGTDTFDAGSVNILYEG
jgi:hypothetical protein